jgi:hypothetical protein
MFARDVASGRRSTDLRRMLTSTLLLPTMLGEKLSPKIVCRRLVAVAPHGIG